jgi:hypothetical protein
VAAVPEVPPDKVRKKENKFLGRLCDNELEWMSKKAHMTF